MYKKFQMLAQIVGCVTIGLLAVYGLFMILSADSLAWAARDQVSMSGVPNVINYQGMLRQPDGSVINGSYTMTFRLYDSPTANIADAVHTEELTNTVVRDGLFTVLLGDRQPIDAAAFKQPLYVGIQVENDAEMQPRQRIAPVPYAVQLTDGVYVDESGNVGVGTTDPQVQLDVNGDVAVSGDVALSGDATVSGVVSGDVTVSGNVNANGLRIDGSKPLIFRKYILGDDVNHDTGYSASDYVCGIVGFAAWDGDIEENDTGNIILTYMYPNNGTWWIRADFRTHNNSENWDIWIMCVDSDIADRIGF